MLQDKSSTWKAWKDECVCICLRFLEHCWANVCPRFTYWDGTTEDAKKEAAKYILYVKYWINSLLKESLAAEHYVPYHPSWPSFFFFSRFFVTIGAFVSYLNGSLCVSGHEQPASFPVRQPFPLLEHVHVTRLPCAYWCTRTTSIADTGESKAGL